MTDEQLQTIKAAVLASQDAAITAAASARNDTELARLLNLPASPAVNLWRTDARVSDISDAINWAQYTPIDAVDSTAVYTNRQLSIQTKQMNLQMMLQGRESLDANKINIRAGLRDAVVAVPAGANGTAVSPGGASGATVLNACVRPASLVESILAGADATTGTVTAKLAGYEGSIGVGEIGSMWNL